MSRLARGPSFVGCANTALRAMKPSYSYGSRGNCFLHGSKTKVYDAHRGSQEALCLQMFNANGLCLPRHVQRGTRTKEERGE